MNPRGCSQWLPFSDTLKAKETSLSPVKTPEHFINGKPTKHADFGRVHNSEYFHGHPRKQESLNPYSPYVWGWKNPVSMRKVTPKSSAFYNANFGLGASTYLLTYLASWP